jgi:hypothetical protein
MSFESYIDPRTGEEVEFNVTRRKAKCQYKEFLIMSHEKDFNLLDSLLDFGLTGNDLRVALALISNAGFENRILVKNPDIKKRTGISLPHISIAIKKLMANKVIYRESKNKKDYTYFLNPRYGWKGKSFKHKTVIQNFDMSFYPDGSCKIEDDLVAEEREKYG